MVYGKQQEEEMKTIRERTFKLKLSDADVKRLAQKAAEGGLTMEELLENFIGDLVEGTQSNGSDERMLAQDWYDRCWFGRCYPPANSLLQQLAILNEIEEAFETREELRSYLGELEDETLDPMEREALESDVKYARERLAIMFGSFTDPAEWQKVEAWRNKRNQMLDEGNSGGF